MQVIDWQLIVKKHGAAVWHTAYKLVGNAADAADCFQETFVSALEVSRRQRVRSFSALLVRLATAPCDRPAATTLSSAAAQYGCGCCGK